MAQVSEKTETLSLTFTREQIEIIGRALRHQASGQEVYAKGNAALPLEKRAELLAEAMGWRDIAALLANDISPASLVEARS